MCIGCFSHLLADSRLKDESATCPNCRCEISKASCSRNLAVEKAISELPTECQFCSEQLPRCGIKHHEKELCQDRCVDHMLPLYKTPGVDGYIDDDGIVDDDLMMIPGFVCPAVIPMIPLCCYALFVLTVFSAATNGLPLAAWITLLLHQSSELSQSEWVT